ncbi:MAG: hypothetical protein AAFY78_18480 [Cyanobacteria bacterium J06648_16]
MRLPKTALLLALPLSFLSSLGAAALARTTLLQVFAFNDATGNCPQTLTAYETFNYYEGGGSTDGMVQLRTVATDIRLDRVDDYSATWVGTLKPEFSSCRGSAGMASMDGEPYQGHSYIRTQFADGQATVILDMTGMGGPNGTMPEIVEQTLREGNPRWTWAVAD